MNQNSKTDLMTLTHPLMLLSIFVLLINDHVLKIHFPSALTGKISDFAGLFFFPILLSAILHFVLKPFQFQSRNIALISFGFTAIFFSLIKTVPFFNDFVEELFSIQVILDPSDLIVLIILPLAWKLREKAKSGSKIGNPKLSYLVLGIALLAALASSPAPISVNYNLIVHDNIVYAEFNYTHSDTRKSYYFYSEDGGKTWAEVDFELPSEVAKQTGKYPELPFTLCLPNNENVCYQTGKEVILESQDSGKTWHISWSVPEGRRKYLSRVSSWSDLGTYDIVAIEYEGKEVLITSAGTEGVLVKINDGVWESIGVGNAGPIRFIARNFIEVKNNTDEEFNVILLITISLLYINILINTKHRETLEFKLILAFPLFGVLMAYLYYAILPFGVTDWSHIILMLFVLVYIGFVIQYSITNTFRIAIINFLLLIVTSLLSYSFFILWAYGTIPVYETAQRIAIGLYILVLLWILFFQAKTSRSKPDLPE